MSSDSKTSFDLEPNPFERSFATKDGDGREGGDGAEQRGKGKNGESANVGKQKNETNKHHLHIPNISTLDPNINRAPANTSPSLTPGGRKLPPLGLSPGGHLNGGLGTPGSNLWNSLLSATNNPNSGTNAAPNSTSNDGSNNVANGTNANSNYTTGQNNGAPNHEGSFHPGNQNNTNINQFISMLRKSGLTPNESNLRSGLTPGGNHHGGNMFAFNNQLPGLTTPGAFLNSPITPGLSNLLGMPANQNSNHVTQPTNSTIPPPPNTNAGNHDYQNMNNFDNGIHQQREQQAQQSQHQTPQQAPSQSPQEQQHQKEQQEQQQQQHQQQQHQQQQHQQQQHQQQQHQQQQHQQQQQQQQQHQQQQHQQQHQQHQQLQQQHAHQQHQLQNQQPPQQSYATEIADNKESDEKPGSKRKSRNNSENSKKQKTNSAAKTKKLKKEETKDVDLNDSTVSPDSTSNTGGPGDSKRKSFLERNRVAASKCRQRKKQLIQKMEDELSFYSTGYRELSAQVTQLRDQLINLRGIVIGHKDCPMLMSSVGGFDQLNNIIQQSNYVTQIASGSQTNVSSMPSTIPTTLNAHPGGISANQAVNPYILPANGHQSNSPALPMHLTQANADRSSTNSTTNPSTDTLNTTASINYPNHGQQNTIASHHSLSDLPSAAAQNLNQPNIQPPNTGDLRTIHSMSNIAGMNNNSDKLQGMGNSNFNLRPVNSMIDLNQQHISQQAHQQNYGNNMVDPVAVATRNMLGLSQPQS